MTLVYSVGIRHIAFTYTEAVEQVDEADKEEVPKESLERRLGNGRVLVELIKQRLASYELVFGVPILPQVFHGQHLLFLSNSNSLGMLFHLFDAKVLI